MITTMANSSIKNPDRRACDRIEYRQSVVLKLGQEYFVNGVTQNISLGGVCVLTDDHIASNFTGQTGSLFIKNKDGELSQEFTGTIMRMDSNSVCLKFDKSRAAQFGILITRGIFKQKTPIQ